MNQGALRRPFFVEERLGALFLAPGCQGTMGEAIDTSGVYRFEEDPAKILGGILVGLACTALGLWQFIDGTLASRLDSVFGGVACTLLFGAITFHAGRRFFTLPPESVTLLPPPR